MKPGEEWTDPNTGKVYVAIEVEMDLLQECNHCPFLPMPITFCIENLKCGPGIIFKAKEEKS